MLATLASLTSKDYTYPADQLTKCWQSLCLCQFHDTLPGTMIQMAVRDTDAKFAEIHEVGTRLMEQAMAVLYRQPGKPSGGDRRFVLNNLPGISRREVLRVDKSNHDPPDAPHGIQLSRDEKSWFIQAVVETGTLSGGFNIDAVKEVKGESGDITPTDKPQSPSQSMALRWPIRTCR